MTPNAAAQQREVTYSLVEEFDDFKLVDGVTLPRVHKLNFEIQEQMESVLIDWSIVATQILHNQQLDPKVFARQ